MGKWDKYKKNKLEKNNSNSVNNGMGKTVINCLSCIYGDYHLNPYKMGVFKN